MQISYDKVIEDIVKAKIGNTKKIGATSDLVRLSATDLNAMSTASTTHVWYGKFICMGLADSFVASYNTTVEFTAVNGITASGGIVGTFYEQLFNKVVTSATLGTVLFVGYKIKIDNV